MANVERTSCFTTGDFSFLFGFLWGGISRWFGLRVLPPMAFQ